MPTAVKGLMALTAAVLIHFVLGVGLTYGNMVPYIVSYARYRSLPSTLHYTDSTYVFACQICGRGICTFLGGILERQFGPRLVTLCGGLLLSAGTFLSYLALRKDFWILLPTYFMIGAGIGVSYVGPVTCVMKWYPNRKGLVTGLISTGFMLGGALLPLLQTLYINVDNKQPNSSLPGHSNEIYFTQSDILDRVPFIYLIMGGIFLTLSLIGSLFIVNPRPTSSEVPRNIFNSGSTESMRSDNDLNKTESQLVEDKNNQTLPQGQHLHLQPTQTNKVLYSKDILKIPVFYILWVIFFVSTTNHAFMTSLYKVYGFQEIVTNDLFMTTILIATSVVGIIARFVWGVLTDMTSYKFTLVLDISVVTCTVSTLYSTSAINEGLYFVWLCVLYFGFAGHFTIFSVTVSQLFGQENFGVAYGMVFTSQIFSGILAALLSGLVIHLIDWWGVFFVLTGMNMVAFFLALIFIKNKRQ